MTANEVVNWAVTPVVGAIVGVYHKFIVKPQAERIGKLEDVCAVQNEVLARLDERTEKTWELLDKKFNGKR